MGTVKSQLQVTRDKDPFPSQLAASLLAQLAASLLGRETVTSFNLEVAPTVTL